MFLTFRGFQTSGHLDMIQQQLYLTSKHFVAISGRSEITPLHQPTAQPKTKMSGLHHTSLNLDPRTMSYARPSRDQDSSRRNMVFSKRLSPHQEKPTRPDTQNRTSSLRGNTRRT